MCINNGPQVGETPTTSPMVNNDTSPSTNIQHKKVIKKRNLFPMANYKPNFSQKTKKRFSNGQTFDEVRDLIDRVRGKI